MSFFKSLFSSDDLIEKGTNALIRTGDALVYTEEEKAAANERRDKWYLELMTALSPSAKSRRGVAWIVTGMVALLSIIGTVAQLVGWVDDAKWILELLSEVWVWPFSLVVTFYFLVPNVNSGALPIPGIKKK